MPSGWRRTSGWERSSGRDTKRRGRFGALGYQAKGYRWIRSDGVRVEELVSLARGAGCRCGVYPASTGGMGRGWGVGSHLPSHGESDCTIRSGLPVPPSRPTAIGVQASDTHDVNLLTECPAKVNISP